MEDLPPERDDQPGGFRNRDELKRGQQPPDRVVPTDEGFGTDEPARVGRDDRLVVDLELAGLEAFSDADGRLQPPHGVGVHVGPVHLEAPLSVALRQVHGEVRIAQEVVGRLLRAPAEGDADAGPHRHIVVVDAKRRRQALGDALGHRGGCLGHRPRLDQHGELVSAEPGHGVAGAGGGADAFGHGYQQAVAGRVPEAVIDRLEVVEVQEQHADRIDAPVASVHGVREPV